MWYAPRLLVFQYWCKKKLLRALFETKGQRLSTLLNLITKFATTKVVSDLMIRRLIMSVIRKVLDKVLLKREFWGSLPQSSFTSK